MRYLRVVGTRRCPTRTRFLHFLNYKVFHVAVRDVIRCCETTISHASWHRVRPKSFVMDRPPRRFLGKVDKQRPSRRESAADATSSELQLSAPSAGATETDGAITPRPAPETTPLGTLDELLEYQAPGWGQGFAPVRPRFSPPPLPPSRSRLLVCHDLDGGYGADRLMQGGAYDRPYRLYDWGLVDLLVYFRWGNVG